MGFLGLVFFFCVWFVLCFFIVFLVLGLVVEWDFIILLYLDYGGLVEWARGFELVFRGVGYRWCLV